jgi:hypothetical protein
VIQVFFAVFCPLAGLVRLGRRRKVARPQKPDYSGRDRNRPQCAKNCRYAGLRRMTGWDLYIRALVVAPAGQRGYILV